ncbi:glycosyltransferase family 39 protein [uncultured Methanobrevibacter sp.]|uniref:glycosyltransferase family 39 protein n=1 Tax=uncultured Methanobrevibacter sp. TaxID=253161 RepID=UPI0025EA19A8|nr:glycosyltransferase family 39 protein [uncultured Methanobrevibacter sp.]
MDFKQHKNDIITISALTVILVTITLLLLNIDGKAGVYYVRDVFFYLNNALFYAGYDTGFNATKGLSPFIPMLTSLFFRMGFIYDFTIIVVSSVFYILSGIGIYFLFRLRFSEVLSFTGAMILATFPLVLVWVTKGMIDIPGMCISIWAVYFMRLSFKKDPKFSYLAFALVILGFFTRYTGVLMIPVLLIQYLLVDNPIEYIKENLKHIVIALCSGALVFAIFIGIYYYLDISLFFVSQGQGITQAQNTSNMLHYFTYYVNNIPIYLGSAKFIPYSLKPGVFLISEMEWIGGKPSRISYLFLVIMAIGFVLYMIKLFGKENRGILKHENKKLKFLVILICLIVFLATYTKISIIYSEIIASIALLALYYILNKTKMEYFTLDFVMFYWFMVNFLFFTYYSIKVDRYFIQMLPFFAYSIILSLDLIFEKFKNIKYMDKIKVIVPIGLICLILLCSCVYALSNSPHTYDNQMHDNFMTASFEEKDVCNWLMKYDSQYMNKTIWADRGGDMSFLLKKDVTSVEDISKQSNFTDKLKDNNITYYIANYNNTVGQPYTKLYQNGEVSLYHLGK